MSGGPTTITPDTDFKGCIRQLSVERDAGGAVSEVGEQCYLAADVPAAVTGAVTQDSRFMAQGGRETVLGHLSSLVGRQGSGGVEGRAQRIVACPEQVTDPITHTRSAGHRKQGQVVGPGEYLLQRRPGVIEAPPTVDVGELFTGHLGQDPGRSQIRGQFRTSLVGQGHQRLPPFRIVRHTLLTENRRGVWQDFGDADVQDRFHSVVSGKLSIPCSAAAAAMRSARARPASSLKPGGSQEAAR